MRERNIFRKDQGEGEKQNLINNVDKTKLKLE